MKNDSNMAVMVLKTAQDGKKIKQLESELKKEKDKYSYVIKELINDDDYDLEDTIKRLEWEFNYVKNNI